MNIKLKELKDITAASCVTLILNTHRTSPDSNQDTILLKNLCKEAEERLLADESKRDAKKIIDRLHALAASIDHHHNLESLVLFVNEDIATYTRLPMAVTNRVVLDTNFATRDLVRAQHQEANYYILVLSQQKARLIEAFNDKVVKEYSRSFPIENTQFYSTSKGEQANAPREANLLAAFFNSIDKELNSSRAEHALPVLICTEQSNYAAYLKIADQPQSIFDIFLNKNRLDEKAHHIVTDAWELIKEITMEKNNARKAELATAVSTGSFLSDVNDIWQAIHEGRVQTLFIEEGLFQAGVITDNTISFSSDDERSTKDVTDDIYDELIEAAMSHGGDAVFLPAGNLTAFQGFGAITRF
jgi:hypothetical protein